MKRICLVCFVSFLIISCKSDKLLIKNPRFSSVKIDTLLTEKMSSRALLIDNDKLWYAANNGKYGFVSLIDSIRLHAAVTKENLKLEFRSIGQTKQSIFILCVANPALLYKIDKVTKQLALVYEEKNEKVFYDSMLFMNEKEGIAIGDPTLDCPSIITTEDGGSTWKKRSCSGLPKFEDGEAFFAASNTNIRYKNNTLFMVSGGKKSRVYVSTDKGITWNTYETPMVQGQAMTGAFCADFYDENIGIIAGGNYEKPLQNFQNKATTKDGGRSWQLIADHSAFGYASCIQFVPNSGGKSILEVGANGIFYSRNSGKKWIQLATDTDLITFRFIDSKTAVASGKNRIVKLSLK